MNRSITCAGMSFVVTLFLAGCAQNPDIRNGHDTISGTTTHSTPDYIKCVEGELMRRPKVFTVQDDNTVKLFVQSTDPNQAAGLVEISGTGQQRQFNAYQRDAWYDQGELLDAARMCSYS